MRLFIIGLTAVSAVLGLSPVPGAAAPLAGVTLNPCQRLNADEVLYPTYGAERVTFATARAYRDTEVLITGCVSTGEGYVEEWQSTGFAGRSGFAPPGEMWQNTLYSPSGSFSFTEALGRKNPGTELEYHTINQDSRWGGEPGPTYNQYFEGVDGGADENLWFYLQQGYYEQAAVINWNREPDMPTVQGASFAIFLHAGNSLTVGCISTDLETVTRLLKSASPGDRIVMGVEAAVFTEGTKTTPEPHRPSADADDLSAVPPAVPRFPLGVLAAGVGSVAILIGAFMIARKRKNS